MWSTIGDYAFKTSQSWRKRLLNLFCLNPQSRGLYGSYHLPLFCVPNVNKNAKQSPRSSSPQLHSEQQLCPSCSPSPFVPDRLDTCVCVNFTYAAQRLNCVFVLVGYASLASQWTEWKHFHLQSFRFNSWIHDALFIFAVNSYGIRVKQDSLHVILDNFWQQHDNKHLGFGRLQKQWCTKNMPAIHMWSSLQHTYGTNKWAVISLKGRRIYILAHAFIPSPSFALSCHSWPRCWTDASDLYVTVDKCVSTRGW